METIRHKLLNAPLLRRFLAGLFGILAFSAPCICASVIHARGYSIGAPRLTARFAVGDFDGDQRADFAEVVAGEGGSQTALYWIAFQFSNGPRRSLRISGPAGGLEISPVDVNADGFLDLVVTAHWTRRPVAVLLNDGRGNFRISNPELFPGAFLLPNLPLGIRSFQLDFYSTALFYSGHDWNCSGLATRLSTQSAARCNSLGDFRTARGSKFHHLPSRAPPTESIQS